MKRALSTSQKYWLGFIILALVCGAVALFNPADSAMPQISLNSPASFPVDI